MRFFNSFEYYGSFDTQYQKTNNWQDGFISLPFFANILGQSISELAFEKYNIRVKKEFNNKKWLEDFSS